MQRVTPDIGDAFDPAEQALREALILYLFQGLGEGTPERGITLLPMKQAGLALPDPIKWPLRTGGCPVLSHDILLHHSGGRRSSGRMITHNTYKRGERRCRSGASCQQRNPWRRPWQVPLYKMHTGYGG